MNASNLLNIVELKKTYVKLLNGKGNDHSTKVEDIRLFCLGKELKDDLFLYSYDVKDEMVI